VSGPLIEAVGLVAGYGRLDVLRGIDLKIQAGELAGIVGENGSGKSTLLKALCGLLDPRVGEIRMRGRLGYCPQEPLVFGALTVRENFRWFASAYGVPNHEAPARALMRRLDFERYADFPLESVSGGTRQKLNLSLSLLHEPDLLILDEPYAGFDWETYLRFWELASELRGQGRAVLVVSHLVFDRERFDHVYELREGVLRSVPEA
jgi:ABC-2 type transport system ATP-binding protein